MLASFIATTTLVVALAAYASSAVVRPCSVLQQNSSMFATPIMNSSFIPKYKSKVPNPLHPSFIFTPNRATYGPSVDYYEIGMRQFSQQILPLGCPPTQVWGYGNANDPMDNPVSYNSPSKTIIAFRNRPTKIKFVHTQLPTTHLFPIDRTFHCGTAINCSPDVRTVVHLHGGHVEAESDGFPDAWRAADNSKNGSLYTGDLYTYDNSQEGATLWYHDHAQGITRLNVYAGLAGFYIIRSNREMKQQANYQVPGYPYDIPLAIQDRSFRGDGALAYPDAPFSSPRLVNMNFGNVFMVNGVSWPKMLVEPRKYRLRLLNGCNSRFLALKFVSTRTSSTTVLPIVQYMSDGGLLNAPLVRTNDVIVIAPAERIDIIVDFGAAATDEKFELVNSAPVPYPFGTAIANDDPMRTVMLFKVKKPLSTIIPVATHPPSSLRKRDLTLPPQSVLANLPVRRLILADVLYNANGITRLRRHLGTNDLGALDFCSSQNITETPALGSTEIWEMYNPTGETHPMHIHLVMFQVISYHDLAAANAPPARYKLGPNTYPVPPEDQGLKDTIKLDPGRAVRVIAKFDKPGLYVWHCHLLEHEDYDMMRPICVGGGCPMEWQDMAHMPW